ncbi:unnamed protein product, partial [Timema podura]|nr:unnamed protein product [Timema podura]
MGPKRSSQNKTYDTAVVLASQLSKKPTFLEMQQATNDIPTTQSIGNKTVVPNVSSETSIPSILINKSDDIKITDVTRVDSDVKIIEKSTISTVIDCSKVDQTVAANVSLMADKDDAAIITDTATPLSTSAVLPTYTPESPNMENTNRGGAENEINTRSAMGPKRSSQNKTYDTAVVLASQLSKKPTFLEMQQATNDIPTTHSIGNKTVVPNMSSETSIPSILINKSEDIKMTDVTRVDSDVKIIETSTISAVINCSKVDQTIATNVSSMADKDDAAIITDTATPLSTPAVLPTYTPESPNIENTNQEVGDIENQITNILNDGIHANDALVTSLDKSVISTSVHDGVSVAEQLDNVAEEDKTSVVHQASQTDMELCIEDSDGGLKFIPVAQPISLAPIATTNAATVTTATVSTAPTPPSSNKPLPRNT